MPELVYSAICSLDGFIEDRDGRFEFAVPDEELHTYVNDLERDIGTHLYGRRMYETMAVWETMGDDADAHPAETDYARLWRGLDKVVYSLTLDAVTTSRTRLERAFDPVAVRALKDGAARDLSVSGPGLARHAFAAGLVDRVDLFLFPVVVGGGKPALPSDGRIDLELVGVRRFTSGVVHLSYRVR
jgi:dihydrofolate reductase